MLYYSLNNIKVLSTYKNKIKQSYPPNTNFLYRPITYTSVLATNDYLIIADFIIIFILTSSYQSNTLFCEHFGYVVYLSRTELLVSVRDMMV